MIDAVLAMGLGAVAAALVVHFVFISRQLADIRRQVSALRVQIGTLRLIAADRTNGKPPDEPPGEPPAGARRRRHLWVVPAMAGVAEVGRKMRRLAVSHPLPTAATAAAVTAAVGASLFLAGTSPHHDSSEAGPVLLPTVSGLPSYAPTSLTAPSRPPGSAPSPSPAATPLSYGLPVSVVPSGASRTQSVTPVRAMSPTRAQAGPGPTVAPASRVPATATATSVAPAQSPTPSGLCLRIVVDPILGNTVCVLGGR